MSRSDMRRMLRLGKKKLTPEMRASMDPVHLLILGMAEQMGGDIEQGHLTDLVTQAIDHYGSAELALAALNAGKIKLEKIMVS